MNPVGTLETAKAVNPVKNLLKYGQSVWLDYIRRNLITSGELKRLIDEDDLRGMTSNPGAAAISGDGSYIAVAEDNLDIFTSKPGYIMLWNGRTGYTIRRLQTSGWVTSLRISV